MSNLWVENLYYIPKSKLDMQMVNQNFVTILNETDDEIEELQLYKELNVKGKPYIGLPRGNPKLVKACLLNPDDFNKIEDKQADNPAKIDLKFNGKYRDYQAKAIKEMVKHKNGILQAMPRTGKCVIGNTIIPTTQGYYRIENIPVGNLLSTNGDESYYEPLNRMFVPNITGYTEVKAVYACPNVQTYFLETNLGYKIHCTDDERFLTNKGWVKYKDLTVGTKIKLCTNQLKIQPRDSEFSLTDAKLLGYLANAKQERGGYYLPVNQNARQHINFLLADYNYRWEDDHLFIDDFPHKVGHKIPDSILVSSFATLKGYLKALYEGQFHHTNPVSCWRLPKIKTALDVQAILMNWGLICNRVENTLYFANIRKLYSVLGFTYDKHLRNYVALTEFDPWVTITKMKRHKVCTVYDLVVGNTEDQHNFSANGVFVHNTVMGTGLIIERQQKTLILAHQTDLIEQFCNETINQPQGLLFNGVDCKKPQARICKKYKDFLETPISLATYQTFLSKGGQKLLHQIKDLFGLVLVDEVHRTPADRYTQILSQFSAKYMYGLTATPDRKDGKFNSAELIIGNVVHNVKANSLAARVSGIIYRGPVSKHKTWNGMMNHLFNDDKRNAVIAKRALADVARGHTVLIPVTQHAHAASIAKMIALYSGKPDMVFLFTGQIPKNKRQWARDEMNNNPKIKIVIAMRSMLTGVNIPRWSAIYTVVTISNEPNYTQEVFRVCTPMEGKKTPVIRFMLDTGLGASFGCLRTCLKTLAKPENKFYLCKSFKRLIQYKPDTKPSHDEEFAKPFGSEQHGLRF